MTWGGGFTWAQEGTADKVRFRRAPRRHHSGVGFPKFEHNQWTFEGRIERLAAFARGAGRATGAKRAGAKVVAVAILLPFGIWFVAAVVDLISG